MEATVGNGCLAIIPVKRDGRIGLLLEQTCEPHDINSFVRDARCMKNEYVPGENDVVIWIDNIAGARVLQDNINWIALHLENYEVNL